MAAAADATTAMTIDFLRARLLSERSVSRAAKERARPARQAAQRRKAERAAAEVLAILDSQGFGRLSDASDESSGSDGDPGAVETVCGGGGGNARGDAPEDALSGSELGGQASASAAQAGGLSWKGRRPPQQQRGRQLRQRQGHGHRRGYLYTRAADSSPKYHPGQSCRKIKRKELRSQREGREDIAGESAEEGQERSDCTVCTDERPDMDGEGSQDGRGSSSNGRGEDGGERYGMDCGKDGEMERVLEKQAELIGQYEAEENAQREWEKKFSASRDSTADTVNLRNKHQMENACGEKETAQIMDKEVFCEQTTSSKNNHSGINKLSEYLLPEGSVSGLLPNAAMDCATEECKVVKADHDFGKVTAIVASSGGGLQVRKDVLEAKGYMETVEETSNTPEKSPQESCDSSLNAGKNKDQGDGNSDSGLNYNVNARSSEHYINTPSVGSPSCDTPKSEVSEWSSSCFHNHTDNQLDTQLYQSSCNDVGGVLEALQRAKMSLREKLSRPSPPIQNMLALPALEDRYTNDLPVAEMQLSLSRSTPLSQEILALQAPAYYINNIAPQGDTKFPVGQAGLFRVPTDSFPTNWTASSDGYGSRFSLAGTTQFYTSPSYTVTHIRSTSLFPQYSSGCYPHSSMPLPISTAGGCSIPESDFRIESASFLPEIPRPRDNLRKMLSGDAGMSFQ
ncbi:hypothetical protein PR202_ga05291 [Eleusine coracana subsp. coracana]|uniref:Uncharacterized protein n=1 Tax=Eleusine coracana subsp. coracana TaxID=191504 RepID=A0AAV5BQX3_ELECO|nr:hypothetical protein PR202_ga04838 [Eleusine coracana subsp. coracana]GJM89139.1 hypothetical protein PR202_ga05291 [Eleusine coracana subsp. coracana]